MNAGAVAVALVRPGKDLAVVGLGSSGHGGEQVVLDRTDVEFVEMAAECRSNQADDPIVGNLHLLASIEIEVLGLGFNPGFPRDRQRDQAGFPP